MSSDELADRLDMGQQIKIEHARCQYQQTGEKVVAL